jgi:hypothetical protein
MRVAKVWNKLPDQVIHAASTNAFKNRLDIYWESEEIYYSDHRVVDAACMTWSGNLFQTFATRIAKLIFLKLVLIVVGLFCCCCFFC